MECFACGMSVTTPMSYEVSEAIEQNKVIRLGYLQNLSELMQKRITCEHVKQFILEEKRRREQT